MRLHAEGRREHQHSRIAMLVIGSVHAAAALFIQDHAEAIA